MSGLDPYSTLSTKFGQLAGLLIGKQSLFAPRVWDRSTIHVMDESNTYPTVGNVIPQWGQECRFVLPKRATLIGTPMVEWTLSAGAATNAAYVNNLGDQMLAEVTLRYGNHVLHSYTGESAQLYRRLTRHEVFESCRDELTLGNRRQGAANGEAERVAAYQTANLQVFSPLDELYFTHHFDEYWMPEAVGLEADIVIRLQTLARVVYTPQGAAPAGALPTITSCALRVREVTLTAPEKNGRLGLYQTQQGHLIKFLDTELDTNHVLVGTQAATAQIPRTTAGLGNYQAGGIVYTLGADREFRVPINNIRLDVHEFYFVVRSSNTNGDWPSVENDWFGDPLDSVNPADATAPSSVTAANAFNQACMFPITSFRLESSRQRLTGDIPELVNRAFMRMLYHKNAQPRDFVYFYSPAAIPDNRKHVTSFLNSANLGNLELVVTMRDFPSNHNRRVDIFAMSHNIIQSKRGDVVKSLK
jgi:hypothetical protein